MVELVAGSEAYAGLAVAWAVVEDMSEDDTVIETAGDLPSSCAAVAGSVDGILVHSPAVVGTDRRFETEELEKVTLECS